MTSNDSTTEAKFMQFSFPSFGDMLATSGGTPTATSSPLHNLNALGLGALDTSLGNPNALLGHHHHHHQLHQHHQHMQQQNPNVHHDVADHLSCLSDNQGNLQQHQLPPQHQTQPQPHLELNQQQSQQPGVPGAGDMSNPTEGIITASLLSAMAAAHSIRFPHAAQLNPSAPQLLNPQAAPNGNLFDASVVNPADASAQAAAAAMPTTVKRKRRSSKANILQGNAPIMCSNCNAVNTPLWRTGEGGRTLCNKCGLYWKRNGTQRPPKLDRRRNSAPNVAATKQKRSPKRPRYDNPESSAAQDYSKTINLTFLESNGQGSAQAAQQPYNQELLNNLIDRRMSIDDEMSRLSADADIRRMSVDESMVRSGQDRLDNINAFPQIDFSQLQSLSMQLNPTLPVNPNAQAQASQTYNKLYEIVQQQQQRIEELKKQIGIQQYLKQFSTTKSGANDFLLSASSPIGLSGSVSPSVAMTTSSAPDYSDQMSQDMSSQLPQISVQPPQGSPLQNQQAFSNLMNSMNYPLTITTNGTKSQMPNHEIFTLSPLLLFSPKTPDRDLVNNFLLELEQPGSTGANAEGVSTTNFAVTPHKEPDTNSSNVNNTTASSNFSLNF